MSTKELIVSKASGFLQIIPGFLPFGLTLANVKDGFVIFSAIASISYYVWKYYRERKK